MGTVIAFKAKTASKRKKMEWVTTSLINMNGFYAPSRYAPGDPIRVQLRLGGSIVLDERTLHTEAELAELLTSYGVQLSDEARLYYLIRGTVRERWLWLWGADWYDNVPEIFQLLQQRFGANSLQEWVFEEEARVIFDNDMDYLFSAATRCDWLTYPAYAAQMPAEYTYPFLMAVRNGKAAYQLWLKREAEEAEERRQEALRNPPEPNLDWDLEACKAEVNARHEAHMAYLIENGLLQKPVLLGVPVAMP